MKRSAIICIPGFRQNDGPSTGIYRLYARLCDRYHDRRQDFVALREWDSDHAVNAALIQSHAPEQIIVIAYSYGAGHGLIELADELRKLGRDIDAAFLIDPVPRHGWGMKWISGFTRMGDYHVPQNVRCAYAWRQLNGSPYGREAVGIPRIHRAVYGTADNLEKYAAKSERVRYINETMDHGNIDDNVLIRDEILQRISDRVKG